MAYSVPTIFSAIDRMTAPLRNMTRGVSSFASKAQGGLARVNRLFSRLTPNLSEAGRQLVDTAKSAVAAGTIIAGIGLSANAIADLDKANASFRTIVSDLDDADFGKFTQEINRVARASKGMANSIDVSNQFETIAGLNADFAKTASGLGKVASAAITLSKASGDDGKTSAENLVGIMNQFSLQADQADRTINVLAAGQAVGAASISESAQALKNFGAVAKSSNITLEESMGLIQTLAAKSIKSAEAGTALRGVILKLQKAGAGYKSGVFNINDALDQAAKKYNSLSTARKKDAFLLKLFGQEGITGGKIILGNIEKYQKFTLGVKGTSEAVKAATINSGTLGSKIESLKNSWVNFVTGSEASTEGLKKLKEVLTYVIDNFDKIISIGIDLLKYMLIFRAITLATSLILGIYNIVLGVNAVLTNTMTTAIAENKIAMAAATITTGFATVMNWLLTASLKGVTAAQWLWNKAMAVNPIVWIVAGIIALIAVVAIIIEKWDSWGASIAVLLGPIGMVISLIQAFRRNWDMVKKAFKEGGILEGLKAIGRVILDALIQPIESLLSTIHKFTGFKWAKNAADSIHSFRQTLGVSMEGNNSEESKPTLVSPTVKSNEVTNINDLSGTLGININDPGKNVESTKLEGFLKSQINLTKTQGAH